MIEVSPAVGRPRMALETADTQNAELISSAFVGARAIRGPHLRRVAARESRTGARRGTGALALGAFGRRCGWSRLARLLLLVGEDLLRRLAGEQGDELLGVDRLPLQQQLRDPLEVVAALAEQALGGLVGA